jgi:RHS repeat-associated protein
VQADDYYPFGLTLAGTAYERLGSQENRFKYNGKELQDDLGLDTYAYEFRMYDPAVGRWWQHDPVVKENMSPYSWVTNNPIRYSDILGLDSAQLADAIKRSNEIVNANPDKDPKLYHPDGDGVIGAKGIEPGEAMDCSGMAANWRKAGDENNPITSKKGRKATEERFGKETEENILNGVKYFAATAEPVEKANIKEGNEVYFSNYGHIGLITNVNYDDQGNPISINFQHSGRSTGPTTSTAKLDGTGYWGSRINSFGKWDTKPDKVSDKSLPIIFDDKYVKNHY